MVEDNWQAPPGGGTYQSLYMYGGRQSSHALIKRGTPYLDLRDGEYRFDGGTAIEGGGVVVNGDAILRSNTTVFSDAYLSVFGEVRGDVAIHAGAQLVLIGTVTGNILNDGTLGVGVAIPNNSLPDNRLQGDYRQTASGTLAIPLPYQGYDAVPLQISGRADLDGTLQFYQYIDWDRGPLPLPVTAFSQHILHAEGGVFGQFDRWTSPGLFITGSLRYLSNDIYFDATSLSALSVMTAASAGDALTLNAAGNFDAALATGDAFAAAPGAALNDTQRQFLQSAASIQRIGDYDQAVRTFDSLSGYGHVAAVGALLQQAVTSASQSSAHLGNLGPGSVAGLWAAQPTLVATGAGAFTQDQSFGYDQWLSDRLVFGSSFGRTQGNLQFERSGGSAYSQAPQWKAYLRRNGNDGSYLMGEVGYSHQQLSLARPIELGTTRQIARSERTVDVTNAYVESGRSFRVGGGHLTPFAALGYAALNSAAFSEQGSTGFELAAQASLHQRVSSDLGLRYDRSWSWPADQQLRLNLGAGYQHLLVASDDLRAAFAGRPGVEFELGGLPRENDSPWLEVNLIGSINDRCSWLFNYANRASEQALSMGMELELR